MQRVLGEVDELEERLLEVEAQMSEIAEHATICQRLQTILQWLASDLLEQVRRARSNCETLAHDNCARKPGPIVRQRHL